MLQLQLQLLGRKELRRQQVFRRHSLRRILAQEGVDDDASDRRDAGGDLEESSTDLPEQVSRIRVVEGIATHEHREQNHPQGPAVGATTRVPAVHGGQDLRRRVDWAAVLLSK